MLNKNSTSVTQYS